MTSPAINFQILRRPALIAAALAFLYANVLTKLAFDWWTDENYSHGLLVPFVIGFIVWSEFDRLKRAAAKPAFWFGFALILFALLMLLSGTLGAELFTRRVSLIVMLAGITVYFFGARILKSLVVPFLLLLFAIPIPQIVFNKIAFPLQILASQAAVWGIRLFAVPTVRKGNVIEILPRGATQIIALEVVEACSGIRSLMTLVTIALVLSYFTRARGEKIERGNVAFWKNFDVWRAVFLMISAVPIAVLTNAARVTLTGVLTYYYGRQATMSVWHALSGWLVYLVALALLFALNLIFKKLQFARHKSPDSSDSKPEIENPAVEYGKPKTRDAFANSFYRLFAVLLIGGLFINWFEQRGEAEIARKPLSEMSSNLGDWKQKGNEIRFDASTESVLRTTDYTMREYTFSDGRIANLYVGYYASQRAGATYHSPQNCLPGAGWTMRNPEPIEVKTAAGKSFTANKFIIENGVYKEVLIYWYQGRGRIERSEYADKINTVIDGVWRRRSDGAMVRVMTSVGNSEQDATAAAIDLAAQAAESLDVFVPE